MTSPEGASDLWCHTSLAFLDGGLSWKKSKPDPCTALGQGKTANYGKGKKMHAHRDGHPRIAEFRGADRRPDDGPLVVAGAWLDRWPGAPASAVVPSIHANSLVSRIA